MKRVVYAAMLLLGLSMMIHSCGQNQGKNKNETINQATTLEADATGYEWLQGEWKNAVYGDIVAIYSDDSIRFLKNGLVFSEEDEADWMWDYPKPETIDDLDGSFLSYDKFPYEIGNWYEMNKGENIEALLFNYLTGEYPFEPISTYLGIDKERKQLYYYSDSGEKVFLTKTSEQVYDEHQDVLKRNENLSKEIAMHEFDWLRGYWDFDYDITPHIVVNIDDDSVKVEIGDNDETTGRFVANSLQTQKNPLDLQYQINEFTHKVDLALVPLDIYVDKESRSLYTYYDFDQRFDFEHVSERTQDEQPSIEYYYGEDKSFTTEGNSGGGGGGDEHAYVDLGLPSGTLWATCNVGADAPVEYGDYFAWGETTPKDTYNLGTYQYCNGSASLLTLTKYCSNSSYGYNGFTDNLTTLLPEDDAATANWGSDWRMPTKEEWQELYNNTTVTWTTQNGVNGRLFTASNGNSLFLPHAGYRWHVELDIAGDYGNYWSSSLNTDSPIDAWGCYFNSSSTGVGEYGYRYVGRSVRAVRSSGQN